MHWKSNIFHIVVLVFLLPGFSFIGPLSAQQLEEKSLIVHLTLSTEKSFHGESVFFKVEVSHHFKTPISMLSMAASNRCVIITLKGKNGLILKADQMSAMERDGLFMVEQRRREGLKLAPGKKLILNGDLLTWFGPIPEGEYKVSAEYRGILRSGRSGPVILNIKPAHVSAAYVSDCFTNENAPISSVWTLKDKGRFLVFFQTLSSYLPKNPVHSIRDVYMNKQPLIHAASAFRKNSFTGAIYWQDTSYNLYYSCVHFDQNALPWHPVVYKVKTPFKGTALGSAFTLKNGSLVLPYLEYHGQKLAILKIYNGQITMTKIFDFKGNFPLNHRSCFWEDENTFHFVWTDKTDKKISHAVLYINKGSKAFADYNKFESKHPVLWLDAYIEQKLSGKQLRILYLGEKQKGEKIDLQPKKYLMIWIVTKGNNRIFYNKISMLYSKNSLNKGMLNEHISLESPKISKIKLGFLKINKIKVVQSKLTADNTLAMLFMDKKGELFYASSVGKKIEPITKIIGEKISMKNYPELVTACKGALVPWVYLRYISKNGSLKSIKIDPENEMEPDEMDSIE